MTKNFFSTQDSAGATQLLSAFVEKKKPLLLLFLALCEFWVEYSEYAWESSRRCSPSTSCIWEQARTVLHYSQSGRAPFRLELCSIAAKHEWTSFVAVVENHNAEKNEGIIDHISDNVPGFSGHLRQFISRLQFKEADRSLLVPRGPGLPAVHKVSSGEVNYTHWMCSRQRRHLWYHWRFEVCHLRYHGHQMPLGLKPRLGSNPNISLFFLKNKKSRVVGTFSWPDGMTVLC